MIIDATFQLICANWAWYLHFMMMIIIINIMIIIYYCYHCYYDIRHLIIIRTP